MASVVTLESSAPMRVLEVVGNAIVGGMEVHVERLVPALLAKQCEVHCLCPFESRFTERLRALGCGIHVTPMDLDVGWKSVQFTQALVRALDIDVMHAHLPNAYALSSLVGAITGIRTLATIHGRALTIADLEAYRVGGSRLSVVCENTRMHALALGVTAADVEVIANGIDVDAFDASRSAFSLRAALGLDTGAQLIGFVGRLSPEKNPALFIQAAAIVIAARPEVHFVLVGDGPLAPMLRAQVAQSGLDRNVHFAGVQNDMRSIYGELDLLAMTSDSEAMPLALLEAMASALACVATAVGGVPEVVHAGHNGMLVPARDAPALAASILSLMESSAARTAMGAAAREHMRARFSQTHSVARVHASLSRLARNRERTSVHAPTSTRARRPAST